MAHGLLSALIEPTLAGEAMTMDRALEGKVVVITGASSGIGLATVPPTMGHLKTPMGPYATSIDYGILGQRDVQPKPLPSK